MSAGTVNGKDEVVMRKPDGSTGSYPTLSRSSSSWQLPAEGRSATTAPAPSLGTRTISLYGFDIQDGADPVMQYPLTNQLPTLIVAAMGTPVAIDATDKTYVAWAEADHDMGALFVAAKANGATPSGPPGSSDGSGRVRRGRARGLLLTRSTQPNQ